MIDLHIHTTYSDGDKTVAEILKMCEEKKLEYISLTDHDTCKQYNDKALKDNNIFSGKIIKGTELHAVFQKKNIEILAYDIDTEVINNWCDKYYSEDKLKEQQKILFKRLLDIADKHGIIYNILFGNENGSFNRKKSIIFSIISMISKYSKLNLNFLSLNT